MDRPKGDFISVTSYSYSQSPRSSCFCMDFSCSFSCSLFHTAINIHKRRPLCYDITSILQRRISSSERVRNPDPRSGFRFPAHVPYIASGSIGGEDFNERYRSCRRFRHQALSADHGHILAAASDLRQTHDLLSDFGSDECRDPRYPDHLHTAGSAPL